MIEIANMLRSPEVVPVEDLTFMTPRNVTFKGWKRHVFALLSRLKQYPHIEQYRKEGDSGRLDRYLKEPFARYRDDLVVNWVLPSRLDLETERYVFSRLLKNDFGAGGCHHHKWMSFYRPHKKRLTDVQITHTLTPDGMDIGLFVGRKANTLFTSIRHGIMERDDVYLELINPLLRDDRWCFYFQRSNGSRTTHHEPLERVPDGLRGSSGIWLRRHLAADEVTRRTGDDQLSFALETIRMVWPVYRFYLDSQEP